MSVILKSRRVKFRNTGSEGYQGINAISEEKTADVLQQIEQKGQEVKDSIPNDYTELAEQVDDLKADLSELTPGLSDESKQALLACFQHVAWADDTGQACYNELYGTLFPDDALVSISAIFNSGTSSVYADDTLDSLKRYLTVTGLYGDGHTATITGYELSGNLSVGTNTINVLYDGKTTSFVLTAAHPLDRAIYDGLTYRDIFITNNLFTIGDFESISSLPETSTSLENGDTYYASYGNPKPTISTEVANTGTHSLRAFANGATQMRYDTQRLPANAKLLAAFCAKIERYVTGNTMLQINVKAGSSQSSATNIRSNTLNYNEVTDSFAPAVLVFTYDGTGYAYKSMSCYVGTSGTPNLDAYIDDVIVSTVPEGMNLEDATSLYSAYINISKQYGR